MAIIQIIPAGDLALSSGDVVIASGPEYVRQSILSRFKFFLGEWFLDLREGVPYYRDILIKNPDIDVIRSVFRKVLLTTPGVLEIERFALTLDNAKRELRFDFSCRVEGGAVTVNPADDAFVVTVL
jgi:hypothetical protein